MLITGATGLIGSAVLARLRGEGHEVVAVVRSVDAAARRLAASRLIQLDISHSTRPEQWLPHLTAIDAVVSCAGVFQDSPRDSTTGVHVEGAAALFSACEQAGVRRVIHISAVGLERTATAFSRTKLKGEAALMARDLDWVILRPSVVVGRAAYGGSALMRGLASLPVLPLVPDSGPLQIVQLDDLTRTIAFFVRGGAPTRQVLDVVGPGSLAFRDVVAAYREWLGWRPAKVVQLPRWAADAMFRLGDFAGWLGWRPPMRSTAKREIIHGAIGDPTAWTRLTGISPQSLRAALAAEPASVQERWFARLYFIKPLIIGVLTLFWIATGLISLGPGFEESVQLARQAGGGDLAPAAVAVFSLVDIALGIGAAVRRTARPSLYAMLAVTLAYVAAGTLLLPGLWIDPLGPLLKTLPILALVLVALAILPER